ncbi:hypothetical protein [Streptomyces sp. NBC_01276]|uniref:hypothetical protein n=1 Tax=Streptomyces sp. NBC_01276 TaxID=2903808 RepID=UPI00352FBDB7
MANLHYEILTDPAQLQVSGTGKDEESPGTVHIVVSNPNAWFVTLYDLAVTVPYGTGRDHLTVDPDRIRARVSRSTLSPTVDLADSWDVTTGTYRLESPSGARLRRGEVIVIELTGFPVSSEEGLVLLSVAEESQGRGARNEHLVTLSLLKRAPKIPRNFRADKTLLGSTERVTLRWDGPDSLAYRIQGPDGLAQTVPQRSGPDWSWSPKPGEEPRRDATYVLIATPQSEHQPGYYLTTTVHLRNPGFESVTATNGLSAPWVKGIDHEGRIEFTDLGAKLLDKQQKYGTLAAQAATVETVTATTGVTTPWVEGTEHEGRIEFTEHGARILDDRQAPGSVTAAALDAETVSAALVRGRDGGAGWVRFPADGIAVGHGAGGDLGVVTADRVRVSGINTTWVGDIDGGKGWIEFPQSGVNIRKDGTQEWGTVAADKADLTGINTSWVQGRTTGDGWIEFPANGLNVFQGAGDRQWGTVAAGTADLNDVVTHRARVKERLSLEGGLTVDNVLETQDGPPRLIVHGRLDAQGEVLADRQVTVAGNLTTKGTLRVHGESLFRGKVNANGHLSVRNADAWIMHTNDGQISVQGDLRVHGAFRSDS